jgi:arsenate reductase
MAEGYLRHYGADEINVYSAGIEKHGVNPKAIQIMKEDDIDISHHTSNHIDEYTDVDFDYVITVCDHAREQCPVFPAAAQKIHRSFRDPADAKGSKDQVLAAFREIRDEIKAFIKSFYREELT